MGKHQSQSTYITQYDVFRSKNIISPSFFVLCFKTFIHNIINKTIAYNTKNNNEFTSAEGAYLYGGFVGTVVGLTGRAE